MKRWSRPLAPAMVVCCLLAGCAPSAPATGTPTESSPVAPMPSFACTPEAGGASAPCTQAQYDQQKSKDKLYAEAEAVFRKYFAENIRISRAGGVDEPTQVMLETTSGAYLEDVLGQFRDLRRTGLQARGHDPEIVRVSRIPGQSKAGSAVALRICVDTTKWAFYGPDGLDSTGITAEDETYFNYVDGHLKMIGADGKDVDQCT